MAEGEEIVKKELLNPPPHEPGLLPRWLHGPRVEVIIAGRMVGPWNVLQTIPAAVRRNVVRCLSVPLEIHAEGIRPSQQRS